MKNCFILLLTGMIIWDINGEKRVIFKSEGQKPSQSF